LSSLFASSPDVLSHRNHLGPTVTHTNHTTYLKDGRSIMDVKSHVIYVVYTLIQLLLFFLAQLPAAYKVEVNTDMIVSAISFVDERGRRNVVPDWVLGPGTRKAHNAKDQSDAHAAGYSNWKNARQEAANHWKAYSEKQGSVIPILQVEGAHNPQADITDGATFLKNNSAALKGKKSSLIFLAYGI
jgi:hypothetical protein